MNIHTCDSGDATRDGNLPSYYPEESQRRISTFQCWTGTSPRTAVLEVPVDWTVLNYSQPKGHEDDSTLKIEDEVLWERPDIAERKVSFPFAIENTI